MHSAVIQKPARVPVRTFPYAACGKMWYDPYVVHAAWHTQIVTITLTCVAEHGGGLNVLCGNQCHTIYKGMSDALTQPMPCKSRRVFWETLLM